MYEVDRGQVKQNFTIMFSIFALGDVTAPIIIFPNKRLSKQLVASISEEWRIELSDNGWMNSEIFIDYIRNVCNSYLVK